MMEMSTESNRPRLHSIESEDNENDELVRKMLDIIDKVKQTLWTAAHLKQYAK